MLQQMGHKSMVLNKIHIFLQCAWLPPVGLTLVSGPHEREKRRIEGLVQAASPVLVYVIQQQLNQKAFLEGPLLSQFTVIQTYFFKRRLPESAYGTILLFKST